MEPVRDRPAVVEPVGERRQLTVLFSDLVGSTRMSERLDPEDYREIIDRYRACVGVSVETHGGKIANYVGDGVLAIFGYPVVQEGSAAAAAAAALEIVEATPAIAAAFPELDCATAVRVGLHTGPVVVGEDASFSHVEKISLFGDTPNVAARIQSHAATGEVVVSAVTRRLIGPRFIFDPLGRPELAGVRESIELFRVRKAKTELDLAGHALPPTPTPMIGRKAEMALVKTRWEAACEGDGQVLVVSGNAGIGKSRVVFSLSRDVADGHISQLTLFGSPLHRNSAFHCVVAALGSALGFAIEGSDETRHRQLDALLDRLQLDPAVTGPPLAGLLGFADGSNAVSSASAPTPAPERQKNAIINALLRVCAAIAREQPLLMVLDDVQWIDPSTLEFVSRWIDDLPRQHCLLLITARSEFVSPWRNLAHVTSLELNRFGRRDTLALIETIAGNRLLPALLDQIVARADGVPLFIEELTKMIVEAGMSAQDDGFKGDLSLAIPGSLQDSLMARLDRLAATKEVAQIAAAIGRTFDLDILSRVQDRPNDEVADALEKLIDADLLVRGAGPTTYRFRHALVQDAAYQSMLRVTRVRWHGRIASVIEQHMPDLVEREPELLGHHLLLAGDHATAEGYWLAAARIAMARSANVEAIEHLERVFECLAKSPASEERDRREMDLQILIAVPLAFVKGYAHKSVRDAYLRAHELCRRYGQIERLFKVVYGELRSSMLGGDYAVAHQHAEQLVSLSAELGEPLLAAATERSQGSVLTYLGRPDEAIEHLERGIAARLSRDDRVRGLDFDVVDLDVALNGYLACCEWLRGRSDAAKSAIARALDCASETDHPFSVSFAVAFSSWIHQFTGDDAAVRASSSRLIALSEENTFQFWLGWGRVMHGWARRGDLGDKALAMIELGLDEWRGTGSRLGLSYFLYLHADAALALGRTDRAETIIDEASEFQKTSGEAFWAPELIRLSGEIAFVRGDVAQGLVRLGEAITCARDLGLRGPELRAAIALGRRAPRDREQLIAAALSKALGAVAADDPAAAEGRDVLHALSERKTG